jgi:hypothetical protein
MKSPPVMDPEAPPSPPLPGTPPDDEVWWTGVAWCFEGPILSGGSCSPSPWLLNLRMPLSVGFLAILEGSGPEMC